MENAVGEIVIDIEKMNSDSYTLLCKKILHQNPELGMSFTKSFFQDVFDRHREILNKNLDEASCHLDLRRIVPGLLRTKEGQDILSFLVEELEVQILSNPESFLTCENFYLRNHAKLILEKKKDS
jgi:hypothetical protein